MRQLFLPQKRKLLNRKFSLNPSRIFWHGQRKLLPKRKISRKKLRKLPKNQRRKKKLLKKRMQNLQDQKRNLPLLKRTTGMKAQNPISTKKKNRSNAVWRIPRNGDGKPIAS
jgi:hypothetical protein